MTDWTDGLQDAFNKALAEGVGNKSKLDRIPEGKYTVTIVDSSFDKDKKKITFKLFFPNFGENGITRYKTSLLSPTSINFVLGDLKKGGQECKTLADIPEAVANLKGAKMQVSVKNRKDSDEYQNFYFEEFAGRDRAVSEFHEVFNDKAPAKTDDIPFIVAFFAPFLGVLSLIA